MNGHDLLTLGFPEGKIIGLALRAVSKAAEDGTPEMDIRRTLEALLNDPTSYGDDPLYGEVARLLIDYMTPSAQPNLQTYAPYAIWGKQGIDPGAITQMERAVRLPISVRGALMPDAHVGYGLPVGGVLATHNAVIPYAVGVDIACRMRLTIFDTTPHIMEQKRDKFRKLLETLTCFGTGQTWDTPRHHPVMDDPVWREHSLIGRFKDTAWKQLGTSGSGNHFVEFGSLSVNEPFALPSGQELATGKYLALLSHSGSRRLGFEIANHYTEIAMNKWASLPKDYQHLAWLDLNSGAGEEYWVAMELAGRYASANHAIIHEQIIDALRFDVLGGVENHHNFAWKEIIEGQTLIVHRKGATPAGEGFLGVIPGSMIAPGYVVRGRGKAESLFSAAHGAGRKMSRREAFGRFDWDALKRNLKRQNVELLSAGLDEAPGAYKDIEQVMAAQADLVTTLAEFQPRMVKMDGSTGKNYAPED